MLLEILNAQKFTTAYFQFIHPYFVCSAKVNVA